MSDIDIVLAEERESGAEAGASELKAMLDCILPGSRALVWDAWGFKNDKETPNLWKPATIIRRYGCRTQFGVYPDCTDVLFDHRPDRESRGHFTEGIRAI